MSDTITTPLPDTRPYHLMRIGHRDRTGHELNAVLASSDGGNLWRVQRTCCDTDNREGE